MDPTDDLWVDPPRGKSLCQAKMFVFLENKIKTKMCKLVYFIKVLQSIIILK